MGLQAAEMCSGGGCPDVPPAAPPTLRKKSAHKPKRLSLTHQKMVLSLEKLKEC